MLSFGLREGDASNLALFALAVLLTALFVLMQRFAVWLLAHVAAYSSTQRMN